MSRELDHFSGYIQRLNHTLANLQLERVLLLAKEIEKRWHQNKQVFICGNGGSAGNAIHLANDFVYGVANNASAGMRFHALSANPSIITCLANDVSFEEIYSEQIRSLANAGDLLIVLSGSGNSQNVVNAVKAAKAKNVGTAAIVGFDGGLCSSLAEIVIHADIADMQIAEDVQLSVGHMVMQYLYKRN